MTAGEGIAVFEQHRRRLFSVAYGILGSRADVTELVALNATYAITKNFSANAMASFAANQSNESVFDYEVGNAGGAVSFSVRF